MNAFVFIIDRNLFSVASHIRSGELCLPPKKVASFATMEIHF